VTEKEFLHRISHGQEDILEQLLTILSNAKLDYCIIGGLGVNAYVEPVVSLDLDIVIVADAIGVVIQAAEGIFTVERFPHSINLSSPKSDLRIQIQTDPRYQSFISRASVRNVMGYEMKVASLPDILQGKIWAYSDETRRLSKRQKDLADIFRIIEAYPELKNKLPESVKL